MHKIIKIAVLMICLSVVAACETTSTSKNSTNNIQEPNLGDAAELNTQLAIGYIQRKDYKPARTKLKKAIDQNPNYLPAYKTFAYLYALLGEDEKAEEKYQEALEINPHDPDLSNSYGAFLCTQKKYDEAQEYFKASYGDPFYEKGYLAQSNAGSCYVDEGEFKKAEAYLRQSLRKAPKLSGSLISMAEIGLKTDRSLMARAYIERYFAVKSASAESLWIASQAEKNLGAKEHYLKYARKILSDYPDSDEAGWIEAQARTERIQ